jgi:hypothetical protein
MKAGAGEGVFQTDASVMGEPVACLDEGRLRTAERTLAYGAESGEAIFRICRRVDYSSSPPVSRWHPVNQSCTTLKA